MSFCIDLGRESDGHKPTTCWTKLGTRVPNWWSWTCSCHDRHAMAKCTNKHPSQLSSMCKKLWLYLRQRNGKILPIWKLAVELQYCRTQMCPQWRKSGNHKRTKLSNAALARCLLNEWNLLDWGLCTMDSSGRLGLQKWWKIQKEWSMIMIDKQVLRLRITGQFLTTNHTRMHWAPGLQPPKNSSLLCIHAVGMEWGTSPCTMLYPSLCERLFWS